MTNDDERAFLMTVMTWPYIGFGRMLQLIEMVEQRDPDVSTAQGNEWGFVCIVLSARLPMERMREIVSHLWYRYDPKGAITPDGADCYCLLAGQAAEKAHARAQHDPVFQGVSIPPPPWRR